MTRRTPVAAANWKCHTRLESALALAKGLREAIDGVSGVEKVVCPPFVYLAAVGEALRDSSLRLGSQGVHWEADGGAPRGEPVWAIGPGGAATPDIADEAVAVIRREVASLHGGAKVETVRILYGGSVTAENVAEFVARDGIDGALVGGASLKVDAFTGIVTEIARAKALPARGEPVEP